MTTRAWWRAGLFFAWPSSMAATITGAWDHDVATLVTGAAGVVAATSGLIWPWLTPFD